MKLNFFKLTNLTVSHKLLNYYHFIPERSEKLKRLILTSRTCKTKTVRFRTSVPIQNVIYSIPSTGSRSL